jgi:hypothetical protein
MTAKTLKRLKIFSKSLRNQVKLTKGYIKLSEKRKLIIDRLVDEKQELLRCLKTLNEFLGTLPKYEIDKLMDSPKFRKRVLRILKKYL